MGHRARDCWSQGKGAKGETKGSQGANGGQNGFAPRGGGKSGATWIPGWQQAKGKGKGPSSLEQLLSDITGAGQAQNGGQSNWYAQGMWSSLGLEMQDQYNVDVQNFFTVFEDDLDPACPTQLAEQKHQHNYHETAGGTAMVEEDLEHRSTIIATLPTPVHRRSEERISTWMSKSVLL